jgi:hypothetical protein
MDTLGRVENLFDPFVAKASSVEAQIEAAGAKAKSAIEIMIALQAVAALGTVILVALELRKRGG